MKIALVVLSVLFATACGNAPSKSHEDASLSTAKSDRKSDRIQHDGSKQEGSTGLEEIPTPPTIPETFPQPVEPYAGNVSLTNMGGCSGSAPVTVRVDGDKYVPAGTVDQPYSVAVGQTVRFQTKWYLTDVAFPQLNFKVGTYNAVPVVFPLVGGVLDAQMTVVINCKNNMTAPLGTPRVKYYLTWTLKGSSTTVELK